MIRENSISKNAKFFSKHVAKNFAPNFLPLPRNLKKKKTKWFHTDNYHVSPNQNWFNL